MPTPSQVTLNTGLTNFALGYAPQAGRFIANELAPVIPVGKIAGSYFVYGQEHLDDQSAIAKRHRDGSYARVDHAMSSGTYSCEDYGLEEVIRDPVQANADSGIDPMQDAAMIIREQMLLAQEIRLAAAVAAATGLAYDAAAGTVWTTSTSDPVGDVKTLMDAVLNNTGANANVLTMNLAVFNALRVHPDVLDRIKYGGTTASPAIVTANMLAQLFGVDKVVVGSAVKNTSKQGQNRSLSAVWASSVIALHNPGVPAMGIPCFAAQFSWRGDTGGQDLVAETYRDDSRRGEVVRVRQYRDEVICGPLFGARLSSVV